MSHDWRSDTLAAYRAADRADHDPVPRLIAWRVGDSRIVWHVVDCKCGWDSPLCLTRPGADAAYQKHRRKKARK